MTLPAPGEAETAVLPRIDAADGSDGAATAVLPRVSGEPPRPAPAEPGVPAPVPPAEPSAVPAEPSVPVEPAGPAHGWWRRNRWGLLAFLPVLALALGPSVTDGYEQMTQRDPRQAVVAGADGWVSYAGVRMRLAELTATTELTGRDGKSFVPPAGVQVWRARVLFETDRPEGALGCELWVEDRAGRLYSDDPKELADARIPYAGCDPDSERDGSRYEKVVHFVLPESSTPAAVRVVARTLLPRYARLTAG